MDYFSTMSLFSRFNTNINRKYLWENRSEAWMSWWFVREVPTILFLCKWYSSNKSVIFPTDSYHLFFSFDHTDYPTTKLLTFSIEWMNIATTSFIVSFLFFFINFIVLYFLINEYLLSYKSFCNFPFLIVLHTCYVCLYFYQLCYETILYQNCVIFSSWKYPISS